MNCIRRCASAGGYVRYGAAMDEVQVLELRVGVLAAQAEHLTATGTSSPPIVRRWTKTRARRSMWTHAAPGIAPAV